MSSSHDKDAPAFEPVVRYDVLCPASGSLITAGGGLRIAELISTTNCLRVRRLLDRALPGNQRAAPVTHSAGLWWMLEEIVCLFMKAHLNETFSTSSLLIRMLWMCGSSLRPYLI